MLPLSPPNPELTGGVHDGAGAGSGVGIVGGGAGFLAGALRFGAAFFAERLAGFRAADFATFFFLRAGAAFRFTFVDLFFAFFAFAFFDFFAMISPPDPSYEYENAIGPTWRPGSRHNTDELPVSPRQQTATRPLAPDALAMRADKDRHSPNRSTRLCGRSERWCPHRSE